MADSENFPHEPEVIGSESRIYRQKDVDAAEKQGRAEALAACREEIRQLRCSWENMASAELDNDGIQACKQAEQRLLLIEPAAKALEALLRKEELTAWDDALAFVWNTLSKTSAEEMKPIHHKQFEIQRQLAELEKARAILENKP